MSGPGTLTWVEAPAWSEQQVFARLDPELSTWFQRRFGALSPAQAATLPEVLSGRSTLLSSPTGTGKTLAAFLSVFHELKQRHAKNPRSTGIVAVYVSPLRALAYDLNKNLQQPLSELGWDWLRVGARTGDTPPNERAKQKRTPPHILVTTPESLTLMLSQPAWVEAFTRTRFLIIDELHALAENKRGALLMVAAERLEDLLQTRAQQPPEPTAAGSHSTPATSLVRIGLSATVWPLETMAQFLVGTQRDCAIVNVQQRKAARIELFSPLRRNPYPPAGYTATRVLKELGGVVAGKRTTLIFTNTRSGAESIGLRLKQVLPDLANQIEVHHASLDRTVRLEVEDRLKRGELRAVVCSTSLEMGIDIGSIDLVVMVSAPKGVARALQRLGRSGHSMNETSHGLLVASNINDLAECAVTARMMERRALEPIRISTHPFDVLAQHLVGLAVYESVTLDEAYALVRRAYPFRQLSRADFDRVVRYLEGGGTALERNYRSVFGKLRLDAQGHLALPSPRVAREFYQNIGTISSETMVTVQLGRKALGQVEESFMRGLRPGDVFVLNGRTVRLTETRLLTARVVAAPSSVPTVPRWNANKMPLASGLAEEVTRLRGELAAMLQPGGPAETAEPSAEQVTRAVDWLRHAYQLSHDNARALAEHFTLQARVSSIPTGSFLLVESYAEGDLQHYFFHALIGRSANDALSRIVARRIQSTRGGNALVTIDDYGFLVSLRRFQAIDDADTWKALFRAPGADDDLRVALTESALVKWHFRGAAQTGLMVPRRVQGKERGIRAMQWNAEIIFEVLRQHEPDHPLLQEAYEEATLRFLDLPRAVEFMRHAENLPWILRPLDRVSPFSFGIYVSKIKETMTLEDPETTIERLFHEMYGREILEAEPAR